MNLPKQDAEDLTGDFFFLQSFTAILQNSVILRASVLDKHPAATRAQLLHTMLQGPHAMAMRWNGLL